MKKHRTLILTTLICLLPLVYVAAVYQKLPEQIAIHWGMDGQPNGYASRLFGGFGLPLFLVAVNIIVNIGLDHDPKKENASRVLLAVGKWCVPVISNLVVAATLLWNLSYQFPIDRIVILLVGLLIVLIGNYLPKSKQSYTVGIKLPWTLNSEENWNRTNHMAGYLWMIGGVVIMLCCVAPAGVVLPVVLVLLAVVPCVYSFWLYRKGI